MAKSKLFTKGTSIGYIGVFDSVVVGLGSACGQLLGKIAKYCQGELGCCVVSQDDLAFELGVSTKTVERSLITLLKEKLITDHTKIKNIPHRYTINENNIRDFDKRYNHALVAFLELEQKIISVTKEELRKKYVVGKKELKILRRYVNFYYENFEWKVKFTHIVNAEFSLGKNETKQILKEEDRLVSPERIGKLARELKRELAEKDEDAF